ncbi:MAG: hypothetical protein U0K86_06405, partial [Agathobacter sp.]|nr:hypothetical protein [Agathobacter sp.]
KNQYCFCAYSYEIIHLIKYGSIFDVISAPIFARDSGWPIIFISNTYKHSPIIDSSLYLMISSFDLN